ncbi:hypothetical protein CFIO01_06725 [Colletotrichum fioriniae PJ7]|uniref:Uncharacterized protein n=1 Tax=Colletotrichum fioriniae PJ7 TaxID=1445577 RepID=A0A010QEA2_9PEZI|nr:hypothetical protein CFIO01_06725 [Colletotrichum fioriniae PJ7]
MWIAEYIRSRSRGRSGRSGAALDSRLLTSGAAWTAAFGSVTLPIGRLYSGVGSRPAQRIKEPGLRIRTAVVAEMCDHSLNKVFLMQGQGRELAIATDDDRHMRSAPMGRVRPCASLSPVGHDSTTQCGSSRRRRDRLSYAGTQEEEWDFITGGLQSRGPIKGADAEWLSFECVSTEASVCMSVRFPESRLESMMLQFLHPEPTAQHPKSNMRIGRLQDDKGGWAGDRRDWVL